MGLEGLKELSPECMNRRSMRPKMSVEGFHFEEQIRCRCPFCDGIYMAGECTDEGATEGEPGVMHSEPPCEKFERLEPGNFLRQARLAGARTMS